MVEVCPWNGGSESPKGACQKELASQGPAAQAGVPDRVAARGVEGEQLSLEHEGTFRRREAVAREVMCALDGRTV